MLAFNQQIQHKIIDLIETKNSNLVLSADYSNYLDIINTVKLLHDKIIAVKLHCDIINNFCHEFIYELVGMSEEYNFLIIEDRKFCDIGSIVHRQSENITKYAHLITCHGISGQGVLDGLRENCINNECGVLLIASMSSSNNLIDDNYKNNIINMAKNNDIVVGFISQEFICDEFIHFTPGVNIIKNYDDLLQKYNTPSHLINDKNTDVLIVGRGLDNILDVDKYILLNKPRIKYLKSLLMKNLLINNNIIKYGDFTLSSGLKSNVYYNFKNLISKPDLLKFFAIKIFEKIKRLNIDHTNSIITGVPLGALPLATTLSVLYSIPLIMCRTENKKYGMQNIIEGETNNKQCIVIEDVISSGTSVKNYCDHLINNNVQVSMIFCILNRDTIKKVDGISFDGNDGIKCISLFNETQF
ncbi:orotidine 5'-phosphate decarboxylase [Hokovirus HKV1]|uniref:Uridine 5'-monophosphate synthase n=1 Tax=Hokovirus HKV1 TaxID=1977638 RepID=A0A1V0SHG3_9VIRU|nr:orotidine 5'-phosphate decarboxylase [Hokovirus HKV1]